MKIRELFLPILLSSSLMACGGGSSSGSSPDDNPDEGDINIGGDGEFMISTRVVRYGVDAYTVGGDISPGSLETDGGESIAFNITTDVQTRIYSVTGCDGVLQGNQYNIASISGDCEVIVELFRQSQGSDIVDVAAGSGHSVILNSTGDVYTVGANPDAETCIADGIPFVDSFSMLQGVGEISNIQACGSRTYLTMADGSAKTCGLNSQGQLAIDDDQVVRQYEPATIALNSVNDIQCNSDSTLMKLPGDQLSVVGRGGLGIGVGPSTVVHTPTTIATLDSIGAFDSGSGFGVAAAGVSDDLYVWGAKSLGQLGDGFTDIITTVNPDGSTTTTTNDALSTPEPLPIFLTNLGPVRDIASGNTHTLVLLEDGTVWGWGGNGSGQLGLGSTDADPLLPTEITTLENIVAIEAIDDWSMVLNGEGDVFTFGFGTPVIGQGNNPAQPSLVRGLPSIAQIHSGGGEHALVRAVDGSVWGWGNSNFNQLGAGINDLNFLDPILIFDD